MLKNYNQSLEFILTLIWLVVVLSCVAILLLLYMVKNGAASSVASVFYLVPPTTALQAWFASGESFDWIGIVGFVLAATAVYLVVKKPNLSMFKSNFVQGKGKIYLKISGGIKRLHITNSAR